MRMSRISSRLLLVTAIGMVLLAGAAQAQSSLGIGSAEPSFAPTGFGGSFLHWINQQQQGFYRALTDSLKAMRTDPWQMWGLVSLSFLYGVFHAAGPGHGKAVISSYMIANEVALRRGVLLAVLSSLLQAATAVAVVGAAYYLLRGLSVSMTETTHFMEIASYALIAAFGFWLLSRKLLSLRVSQPLALAAAGVPHGHHDDHHHHDHHHHDHHHDHGHGHDHHHPEGEVCATCGHAHAPDPALISGDTFSLREAWAAVMAVGLRPCSGALIVLTFSMLNGLWLAGIVSAFAMAVGTAITVSALATLAVMAKGAAVRLAGASMGGHVGTIIEILGAATVMALGLLLLAASLQA
ncbi:delayed-early response protein/equilibrative nucleoside transporter [Hoeflea sp. BAL378]|uniref:nickel/cobalt transporter n=1 Tax=Hoeflea sp. BAL378 TaxID=1547437 RepID=UPI000513B490|nr:nickel/cobalt transporter [Hoeflea sp. BAL378]KGF69022.1 delayed-early response protein/equilibrative nucleoside transporter [Hoeflea sp. BAL378]